MVAGAALNDEITGGTGAGLTVTVAVLATDAPKAFVTVSV